MYAEDRVKAFLNESHIKEEDMNPDEVRRVQSYIAGVPYVDLKGKKLTFDVLSYIPEPVARNHSVIAYHSDEDQGILEVALLDMNDVHHIASVGDKTGLKIVPRLTDEESIRYALVCYQKILKSMFGDTIRSEALSVKDLYEKGDKSVWADDVSATRIVETLCRHACIQRATAIHIEPNEDAVVVRYRIGGVLRDAMMLPQETAFVVAARIKKIAHMDIEQTDLPQDGRFTLEDMLVRVSTVPTQYGEKLVMRMLDEVTTGYNLETLGFHGEALENVCEALMEKSGLVVVAGVAHSGKTTTLYTMLDLLNAPEISISTIEDPIETQLVRVNQTRVNPHINFTFTHGLRALLRQDPDVVMVGDIRNGDVATLATQAATTNHMLCAGMYADSGSHAISLLLEKGVDSQLLSSALSVVVGQRLARRLGKERKAYTLSKKEIDELSKECDMDTVLARLKEEHIVDAKARWSTISFYKPRYEFHEYTGYIGIQEVLPVTKTIKDLIEKEASTEKIEKQARKEGMMTLFEDGVFKAVQGLTTLEEVFRVVRS